MRLPIRPLNLFILALIFLIPNMSAAQETQNNERIVFFGDSITQQGDGPSGYVTLVRDAIAKKAGSQDIAVIGAGIGGNRVPDLLARLDRDVLSKNPTWVVIYIGINDVWHSLNDRGTPKDEFEAGLNELVEKINTAGARVILCTPSVIGEKTDGKNEQGLDAMLAEYAQITRDVAAATNTALLDLHKAFNAELESRNPENQSRGILTGDGVHLNEAGNQFVADRMLAALGFESDLDEHPVLLRHIVLFKFTDDSTDEQVNEIVNAFAMLPEKIDTIVDFEMGTNISPENLEQGYTHCFIVSFKSVADRDAYLPHPAHKDFVKLIDGKIAGVLVFDILPVN